MGNPVQRAQGMAVLKDGMPWDKKSASTSQVPTWLREKHIKMKDEPWHFDNNLIPGALVLVGAA